MLTVRLSKKISSQKGFTLVELLVVIAILGILAVGLIAAINPVDKLNAASDSRAISDVGVISRAAESFATAHNGFYPAALADLTSSSDLKVVPVPPTGYGATYSVVNWTATPPVVAAAACTGGLGATPTCTGISIIAPLKSQKYTGQSPVLNYWRFDSPTGKTCGQNTNTVTC